MQGEKNWIDRLVQNRVLSHGLFWGFVWLSAPISSTANISDLGESLWFRGVAMPMKMVGTYGLVYWLIPRYLETKKYLRFAVLFLAFSFVCTFLYRLNNIHIAERLWGHSEPLESVGEILAQWKYTFVGYFFRLYAFTFPFLFLKLLKARTLERRRMAQLEKEKATAELNFLKAQIHPHFLFNTLNNLYSLTLTKSDQAPEVVAKLSAMLDYMLYRCSGPRVRVRDEVELLQHYIDLERLRYGDRLTVAFDYITDDPEAEIAPLLLISLVENAFKHGVSQAMAAAQVQVHLRVQEGRIRFRVFNTKAPTQADPEASGLGTQNVQRQLDLLYPDQYQWQIQEQSEAYEVTLILAT